MLGDLHSHFLCGFSVPCDPLVVRMVRASLMEARHTQPLPEGQRVCPIIAGASLSGLTSSKPDKRAICAKESCHENLIRSMQYPAFGN